METNQLIKALADAAVNAKPAQEYCLLAIKHWSTCMSKSEWSGWMQAIGVVISIGLAVFLPYLERRYKRESEILEQLSSAKYWLARNERPLRDMLLLTSVVNTDVIKDGNDDREIFQSILLFKSNFEQVVAPQLNEFEAFEKLSFKNGASIDNIGIDIRQAYSSFLNAVSSQFLWFEKLSTHSYYVPNKSEGDKEIKSPGLVLKDFVLNNLVQYASVFETELNKFSNYLSSGELPVGVKKPCYQIR